MTTVQEPKGYWNPIGLKSKLKKRAGDDAYQKKILKSSGRMDFVGFGDEIRDLCEKIDNQKLIRKPMSDRLIQEEVRSLLNRRRKETVNGED